MRESENGLYALLTLCAIPVGIICNGLAMVKLWAWFISTTFGADPLTIGQALGIALVVTIFTKDAPAPDDDGNAARAAGRAWGWAVVRPLMLVLIGWAYRAIFW